MMLKIYSSSRLSKLRDCLPIQWKKQINIIWLTTPPNLFILVPIHNNITATMLEITTLITMGK